MSSYVISDIHGCYDELQKMLEKIQFGDGDTLICAGDYIDKGPKNADMLEWIMRAPANVILIRGNHDEDFVQNIEAMRIISYKMDLVADSRKDTKMLYNAMSRLACRDDSVRFDRCGTVCELIESGYTFSQLTSWTERIKRMPYYYDMEVNDRKCIVVHAGYIRKLDTPELKAKYSSREEFYMNARDDGYTIGGICHSTIIAGHTPTVKEGEFAWNDGQVFCMYDRDRDILFYDIDCGCWMRSTRKNARLACIRLEDEEVFYV
jgi:predicted phosphodiesterase